jgi:integrase/recombinase XerD
MTYTFARVGAVVALSVEDYFPQKKRWWLRLREKNGKVNEMPCHHKLEEYLDAYIKAAGIADDRKGPLFRAAIGKTKKLGPGAMSRTDVWYMVRRRASDAGIETPIGCHTFRATGITDYLMNGGRIEVAQRMAGHSNAKTTGLYDRRNDDISVGEVPRSFHFSSEILLNAGTSAGGELAKVSTETARRKLKTSFGRLYPPHN